MSEGNVQRKWARILLVALKIYAGLCTLLVTGVLGLLLWAYLAPPVVTGNTVENLRTNKREPELPAIGLSYDLSRTPPPAEGFFTGRERDGIGILQLDISANRAQTVQTNRVSAEAGSGR